MNLLKDENKEVWALPQVNIDYYRHKKLSVNPNVNWRLLKKNINNVLIIGNSLNRPKTEIQVLIDAGDVIDNIKDELDLEGINLFKSGVE